MNKIREACLLDAATRRAIIKAPEQLTRGKKKDTPAEMWGGYKTYSGIWQGKYSQPAAVKALTPQSLARQHRDPSLAMLDDLIAHPAVFHTPLQEKGDYIFAMLHTNLMTLRVDGRCKDGILKKYPLKTLGTAFAVGEPARLPDYRKVRFRCHQGLPFITAVWQQAGAEWRLDSFMVGANGESPGSYNYNRVLWEKLTVRNPLRKPLRLKLFRCFAEAPRASFGLCHYNRFNGYPNAAWENGSIKLDLRGNEIYREDKLICRVDRPNNVAFRLSNFPGDKHPDSFQTKDKVPCLALNLAPSESIQLVFRTCFSDRLWQGDEIKRVRKLKYGRERAKGICRWEQILGQGARITIPEERVMDAWRAQIVCLHQMHHRFVETDEVLFPNQGPAWPMSLWAGEARYCIATFDQLGLHAEAQKVMEYFIRRQIDWTGPFKGDVSTLSGAFDSSFHWMQDTGVMLGAMGRHYLLSGDRKWLKARTASALMAMDWIHSQRQLTKVNDARGRRPEHYGLLPSARANDGEDVGYFYALTDCPTWEGLNLMVQALRAGGVSIPTHLRDERNDYRRCLQQTIRSLLGLFSGTDFVPHVVYPPKGKQPWYWTGSMLLVLASGVIPRNSALFKELYRRIDRRTASRGLQVLGLCGRLDDPKVNNDGAPRCGIKGTEWYVIAPELDRYRLYLERNEIEKALLTLYSLIAFCLTDTLQSVERINIIDPYWAPVQVNPSGSARIISTIGESIVFEMEKGLSFFRGIPRAWLEPGKHVALRGWKTIHGAVTCAVQVDRTGDCITGNIAFAGSRGAVDGEIVLRHPARKPIRAVRLDGAPYRRFSRDRILLPRVSDKVNFEVTF
ncbi:MAG: hypothetical protein PHW60_05340 [Kiritimatiellae bacterium]|nr:hypothetical protein [Kiritimatiellia bacterium]